MQNKKQLKWVIALITAIAIAIISASVFTVLLVQKLNADKESRIEEQIIELANSELGDYSSASLELLKKEEVEYRECEQWAYVLTKESGAQYLVEVLRTGDTIYYVDVIEEL